MWGKRKHNAVGRTVKMEGLAGWEETRGVGEKLINDLLEEQIFLTKEL